MLGRLSANQRAIITRQPAQPEINAVEQTKHKSAVTMATSDMQRPPAVAR
jgi:hypothetical protein